MTEIPEIPKPHVTRSHFVEVVSQRWPDAAVLGSITTGSMVNAIVSELGRRAFLLQFDGDVAADMVRYELGSIAAYGVVSWWEDLDTTGHVDRLHPTKDSR